MGTKETEATNFLEKKFKANSSLLSYDETVQAAIGALQNVLSEDLKASDIEVGETPLSLGDQGRAGVGGNGL